MPTSWSDVVKAVRDQMPDGTSLKDILPKASAEWKRIKSGKNPTKGMASLTMPGKKDFTTKKTSKVFHRKGRFEKESADGVRRRPYHGVRKSRKGISKLPMSESVLLVDESPMAGGQAADNSPAPDAAAPADDTSKTTSSNDDTPVDNELIQETTGTDVHNEEAVISSPGMPTDNADSAQAGGRRRRRGKSAKRRHSKRGGRRTAHKHSKACRHRR